MPTRPPGRRSPSMLDNFWETPLFLMKYDPFGRTLTAPQLKLVGIGENNNFATQRPDTSMPLTYNTCLEAFLTHHLLETASP